MRWILLIVLSVSLPAMADLEYSLKPRQIAEDTWLLEGSTDNFAKANGGNIVNTAFIVTERGVVVIDTGPSKRYGEAMRKTIAAITDKPVIQVFLTHHHPDHVLGNQAFADVPIGALAGTTELLHQQGDAMAENMYRMVGDWMRGTEVVLPNQVVTPGVLSFGNHDLRLLGLGGHTGADLAILDQQTGVLFAGDLVFYQRALTTPNSPGLVGVAGGHRHPAGLALDADRARPRPRVQRPTTLRTNARLPDLARPAAARGRGQRQRHGRDDPQSHP